MMVSTTSAKTMPAIVQGSILQQNAVSAMQRQTRQKRMFDGEGEVDDVNGKNDAEAAFYRYVYGFVCLFFLLVLMIIKLKNVLTCQSQVCKR